MLEIVELLIAISLVFKMLLHVTRADELFDKLGFSQSL